jgi:hypothetical protein
MAMATKRAVAMAMRVAGKDVGNGEGGKSNGDGAKRAIARKRVMAGPIYKKKNNPLSAPSTNPLQRGCREGLAINTIAMPLDQANGSTMVMFFLGLAVDVLPFFVVGPVLSWRKRYVQNYIPRYVFEFCACGWSRVLFRTLLAERYVFVFLCFPKTSLWTRP